MTGTDLCVNKPHQSRSYLNHLVQTAVKMLKGVFCFLERKYALRYRIAVFKTLIGYVLR